MKQSINIAEAKKHFTELLRQLKGPLTIMRRDIPVAVLLSLEDYKNLSRRFAYEQILTLRSRIPNGTLTATQSHQRSRKQLEERSTGSRH